MVLLVEDAAGGWAPLLPAPCLPRGGHHAATTATTATPTLLAAAEAHAGLAAAASAFLARAPTSLPVTDEAGAGPPAVCCLQGELAFLPCPPPSSSGAPPGCCVGSADATTCVIVAAASPAGVSVAHCDAGTATPSALDQLLAPHLGGGPRRSPPPAVSLHLVGGAAVGPATGPDAGPAVAAALLAAAAARPEPLRLSLALVAASNTTPRRHPRASALALSTADPSSPFPAVFTDRGPAVPLRLARLWAQSSEDSGGAASAPGPVHRRLVPIVRTSGRAGSLELAIPPLGGCAAASGAPPPARRGRALAGVTASRSPRSAAGSGSGSAGRLTPLATQAAALASLADEDLLAAASTSPASEPAHFVADLRAALSVLREDGDGGVDGGDGGAGVYRWSGGAWVRA